MKYLEYSQKNRAFWYIKLAYFLQIAQKAKSSSFTGFVRVGLGAVDCKNWLFGFDTMYYTTVSNILQPFICILVIFCLTSPFEPRFGCSAAALPSLRTPQPYIKQGPGHSPTPSIVLKWPFPATLRAENVRLTNPVSGLPV